MLIVRPSKGKHWGQWLLPLILLAACGGPEPGPTVLPTSSRPALQPTATVVAKATPKATPTFPLPANQATPWPTPLPTPTPAVPPMPIPTPSGPPLDIYTVQPGDTLGYIALNRCGCTVDELAALNGIADPASLLAGQSLRIPVKTDQAGPAFPLLPDSEVVYSPAYVAFDMAGFIQRKGGYLASYTERVNGKEHTGAEIVEMVAQSFSVGPRVLLALLEYQSDWVTGTPATETAQTYPLGLPDGARAGLYFQLSWAANHINEGYYGYKRQGTLAFQLKNRSHVLAAGGLNAGTIGIQNVLALVSDMQTWREAVGPTGFIRTYNALFGDPTALAIEPLVPANLTQPKLLLPWEGGHTWYFSGGPHAAWMEGSAWAALDFAPPDVRGHCAVSRERATAAAPGLVLRSGDGQVLVDLDGDGHEQTGWVLFYLHLTPAEDIRPGTMLAQGDVVGYPSCEGGVADSSHLHFARRYNGEWLAADGPLPMNLSGWTAAGGLGQYEGRLTKGSEVRQACECWEDTKNGLTSDNTVLGSESGTR